MNLLDGLPLVHELSPPPHPEEVFRRMCRRPHCLFLDSALRHPTLGRYSFVAADPVEYIQRPAGGSDALVALADRLAALRIESVLGLPPFQGGAAGLFGYELARSLERVPDTRFDEFHVPALAVGLYDVVVAFDHESDRAWIISQGFPETEPARRKCRAEERLREVQALVRAPRSTSDDFSDLLPGPADLSAISLDRLAPQSSVPGIPHLSSNVSKPQYLAAVARVIDYIEAGDAFQVNLSQRLLYPAWQSSPDLYLRLRRDNPAPFAGYFDLGPFQVVSASPERFLQVSQGQVETRPIKGTRRRSGDPLADREIAQELQANEKDRAENVMIIDLMRNDLGRVCRPASVRVTGLCEVETYRHVLHLVSTIRGQLRPGLGPLDLLRAAFPGGSVTGAPKIRAMQIITELEQTARGAYCGSLGYLGFDGAMDSSILIRTITAGRGWWQAPVGGGVVADSRPETEYQETLDKAEGLIRAMERGSRE